MRKSMCVSSLVWMVCGICLALLTPSAWGACGGISGKVVNSSTSPIMGATVTVFNAANRIEVEGGTTTTDASGNYTVSGLPSGTYKVHFQYNIGLTTNGYQSQWYSNKSSFDTGTTVSVGTTTTTGINATLATGGSIAGTVKDGGGNGIVGIQVKVYNASHTVVGSAISGASGTYTVRGLPTGSYKVSFERSLVATCGSAVWYNAKSSFSTADSVPVTAGSQKTGINATLPAGNISGVVKDSGTLQGLGFIYVMAYDAATGVYAGATTTDYSGTGVYTISALPPGSYKLQFSGNYQGYVTRWYNNASSQATATAVTVTNGATATVNQNLTMGATISGTVTNGSGTSIEGVFITAYESSLGENDPYPIFATTDTDGTYTLQGLRSGVAYKVNFDGTDEGYLQEWYNNAGTIATATSVTPTIASPAVNIDAVLASGGSITGKILAPACCSVEGILVSASDASGDDISITLSASDGTYTLKGLPSGTYTVTIGHFSNFAPATRTASVTAPATTTVANVTLSIGGSISGRITDTSGGGIDSAVVEIQDSAGNTVDSTTADENGYYVIGGLASGSYRVKGTSSDCSGNFQWYNNQALVAVTAPSGTTGINITVGGTVPTATLTVVNNGGGTITSSPAGITCPGTCSATLPQGPVILTAQNNIGYAFTGWSGGGCSGTGTCQINLSSTTTVTATFATSTHLLKVTVAGDGTGTVTSTPSGFTCFSGTCSKSYGNGYQLSLTATPSGGSIFGGWSGGLCAGTGPCALTLTSDVTTTATFSIPKAVKMGASYYNTIQAAYTAAGNGATILARNQLFSETLDFNRGISVSLEGGYDSGFLNSVGVSTMLAPCTISTGQVTMQDFVIQ